MSAAQVRPATLGVITQAAANLHAVRAEYFFSHAEREFARPISVMAEDGKSRRWRRCKRAKRRPPRRISRCWFLGSERSAVSEAKKNILPTINLSSPFRMCRRAALTAVINREILVKGENNREDQNKWEGWRSQSTTQLDSSSRPQDQNEC